MFGNKIPLILPGGYLIGTLLLINLLAAHIYRFQFSVKKIGIQLAHAGVILLLVGQLVTDMLAHETQMQLHGGRNRNYSESPTDYELIFTSDAERRSTVVIPAQIAQAAATTLKIDSLPFAIRVKSFWKNSDAELPRADDAKRARR